MHDLYIGVVECILAGKIRFNMTTGFMSKVRREVGNITIRNIQSTIMISLLKRCACIAKF